MVPESFFSIDPHLESRDEFVRGDIFILKISEEDIIAWFGRLSFSLLAWLSLLPTNGK